MECSEDLSILEVKADEYVRDDFPSTKRSLGEREAPNTTTNPLYGHDTNVEGDLVLRRIHNRTDVEQGTTSELKHPEQLFCSEIITGELKRWPGRATLSHWEGGKRIPVLMDRAVPLSKLAANQFSEVQQMHMKRRIQEEGREGSDSRLHDDGIKKILDMHRLVGIPVPLISPFAKSRGSRDPVVTHVKVMDGDLTDSEIVFVGAASKDEYAALVERERADAVVTCDTVSGDERPGDRSVDTGQVFIRRDITYFHEENTKGIKAFDAWRNDKKQPLRPGTFMFLKFKGKGCSFDADALVRYDDEHPCLRKFIVAGRGEFHGYIRSPNESDRNYTDAAMRLMSSVAQNQMDKWIPWARTHADFADVPSFEQLQASSRKRTESTKNLIKRAVMKKLQRKATYEESPAKPRPALAKEAGKVPDVCWWSAKVHRVISKCVPQDVPIWIEVESSFHKAESSVIVVVGSLKAVEKCLPISILVGNGVVGVESCSKSGTMAFRATFEGEPRLPSSRESMLSNTDRASRMGDPSHGAQEGDELRIYDGVSAVGRRKTTRRAFFIWRTTLEYLGTLSTDWGPYRLPHAVALVVITGIAQLALYGGFGGAVYFIAALLVVDSARQEFALLSCLNRVIGMGGQNVLDRHLLLVILGLNEVFSEHLPQFFARRFSDLTTFLVVAGVSLAAVLRKGQSLPSPTIGERQRRHDRRSCLAAKGRLTWTFSPYVASRGYSAGIWNGFEIFHGSNRSPFVIGKDDKLAPFG